MRAVLLLALLAGCSRKDGAPEPPPKPTATASSASVSPLPLATPNTFLAEGAPTFVVGTLGDEAADRIVRHQARLVQGMFFPASMLVEDTTVVSSKGADVWPRRPVVYGGPHVHAALATLAPTLPFQLERGKLVLGGETFVGDDLMLITVLPARAADADGPGFPRMLIYAGTGDPGVAEINAVPHGQHAILVADRFGVLTTGAWTRRAGKVVAALEPRAQRETFRTTERAFHGGKLRFSSLASEPASKDEEPYVEACVRGLDRVVERLSLDGAPTIDVFLYPDSATKAKLTGNGGAGHAVPSSHTLHVIRFDPKKGGALEGLIAHEGTHVIATAAFGGPGSAALGEGLAVWVSGKYGGLELEKWKAKLGLPPKLADLLGKGFFARKEAETYPASGLLVERAIASVGLVKFRAHLYGATAGEWAEACAAAGDPALAKD